MNKAKIRDADLCIGHNKEEDCNISLILRHTHFPKSNLFVIDYHPYDNIRKGSSMPLEDDYGYRVALDLVTKGVESGAIKLHGPTNNGADSEAWGQADARYLIGLMAGLQANLPKQ